MSTAMHVIAEFDTPGEAQEAVALLQSQGVAAVISGTAASEELAPIVGHHGLAPVQVAVPVADAERAQEVLQQLETTLDKDWEAQAESAVDGWICAGCDTVVDPEESACPECGSLRSEQATLAADEDDEEGE